MPPKSRKRQRPPQIVKAQPVMSLKQSTETVQVMLFGALSTLFWQRGLFPEEAYDHVNIDEEKPFQYDSFASGKDHTAGQLDDLSTIRLLRKGRSARIDKFFRIIEDGIFDALKKKLLKSVQISLFPDSNDQGTTLEAYTFSVTYAECPETGVEISGIEFHSHGASLAKSEPTSLTSFVRQVEARIEKLNLNRLPDGVHMTAHLCYTQDCDENYEPPNFERVEGNVVSFPAGGGWRKEEATLGSMTGAYHEIALEASYLSHEDGYSKHLSIGKDAKTTERTRRFTSDALLNKGVESMDLDTSGGTGSEGAATPVPAIRRNVLYTTPGGSSTSTQSNALPPQSPRATYRRVMDTDLDLGGSTTPSSHIPQDFELRQTMQTIDPTQQPISQLSDAHVGSTQWREDMQMRDDLRKIDNPEPVQQFSVPTQPAFEFAPARQGILEHSQSREPPSTTAQGAAVSKGPNDVSDEHNESDWVRCQCGFVGLDMKIKCHGCQTLQHPQCYGYFGRNDPRRAPQHYCYECLLGDSEPGLLTVLQNASRLRQLMHTILHDEISEKTDLLNSLASHGVDEARAKSLIDLAVRRGYIHFPGQTTRRSQGGVERLRVAALDHGRKGAETLLQLFNPVSGMERFHEVSFVQTVQRADALLLAKSCYPLLSGCKAFKVNRPRTMRGTVNTTTGQSAAPRAALVRKSPESVNDDHVDHAEASLKKVDLVPKKKVRADTPPSPMASRRTPRRSTRVAKLKLSPFNTSQETTPSRRVMP